MRLLHTSDWHLGRSFHREDMLSAQAAFVDHLVATVRAERVDAVLVSGDVYDRALPGVDAVALCDEALRRLAATGATTVLISGNHDSARRLGFGAGLMAAGGVHLRTDVRDCARPVLLADRHGPVAIYPIPYLEPDAVRDELGGVPRTHTAVLTAALDAVRADAANRPPTTRTVALAHAFVTGGQGCESERDISVGGVAAVPANLFRGFRYAALGHLHGPQSLTENLRYSGAPLPYSFSEAGQDKAMWLVELAAEGDARVERVPCPTPRQLAKLSGRLERLLTDPEFARYEDHYLQVTLTDPDRPREPMERLRRRFPHTLVLLFDPEGGERADGTSYERRVRGQDDMGVALGFVEHVRGRAADPAEAALLREAFEATRLAEVSG
jgi:exonuclease SbcD